MRCHGLHTAGDRNGYGVRVMCRMRMMVRILNEIVRQKKDISVSRSSLVWIYHEVS